MALLLTLFNMGHEENLTSLIEDFKVLREEHEGRISKPVREMFARIREKIWQETRPANSHLNQQENET